MARFNTALTSSIISGTATIGTPYSGAFTEFTGTAPYTVTLPSPVLFPGVNQTFYNATSGQVTLSVSGATFNGTGGTGSTTFVLNAGNVVSIFSDGTNYIVISEDGSPLTATTGSFSGNVTINGGSATLSATPQTITLNPTSTSTIDNINIGATTRGSGAFNTLTANQAVTFTAGTASSGTGTGTLVVTGGLGVSGTVYAGAFNGNLTGTIQTAAQTNITSLGTLTGVSSSGRYVVTASSNAGTTDISYGSYADGAWINSPATFQGWLAIAGNGVLKWSNGSVEVIGTVKSTQTRTAALTSFFAEPASGSTGQVGDTNSIVLRVANTASGNTAGISMAASLEASASNRTAIVFSTDGGPGSLTEKARITALGSLLVGSNPTQGFGASQGYLAGFQSGGSQTFISIAKSGQTLDTGGMVIGIDGTGGSIYIRPNQPLDFYTNNTLRMRLDGSGNLGLSTGSNAIGYKLQVAGTAGIDDARLTAINSTIAATAIDVFVYDTRKDSDRGAWRKRTQHTSWYNETLNTGTRGSRREFPAVAVIVATVGAVTIYDGDDPLMPMWMVFDVTNSTWLKHSSGTGCSCVTAMNGQMVTGGQGGAGRVSVVKFITDSGHVAEPSYNYVHFLISTRNTSPVGPASGSVFIVSISVFSVAITVLPGAPVDPYTRLPTPTIAVGTAGGTTIIQNDGRATNITCNNAGYTTTKKVTFLADNALGLSLEAGDPAQEDSFYIFNQVPQYSTVVTVDARSGTPIAPDAFYSSQLVNTANVNLFVNGIDTANLSNRKINKVDRLVFGTDYGITQIDENRSNPSYGMTNFISSKYNTGWMVGNIKGAWLCDSTAETLTTTNLITNPTFTGASGATGPTSWDRSALSGSPTFSVASNILTVNNTSGTGYWLGQVISGLVVGKTYSYSCTVGGSGAIFRLSKGGIGGNANTVDCYVATAGAGTYIGTFFASGTTVAVSLGTTPGSTATFTAVSVWSGDTNRSIGGSQVLTTGYAGLITVGSVTKTLISAGADLVYYSGWSTSNYLSQPYSASMDPTTGEYSVSLWIYTATIANANLVNRSTDDANETMRVYLNSAGQIYFDYGGGSEYAQSLVPAVLAGQWTHITCIAKAGRLGRIYINGQETTYSYQVKAPATFVPGTHPITVGNHIAYGSPFNGSITMVRYSFTVPSNAQIFKMYNDEKELFQTGAKACLYGSSDVITAIANDTTTNLVHVGTSSGRSVLKGIRRVENTATTVSAAISASNGMIAEQ